MKASEIPNRVGATAGAIVVAAALAGRGLAKQQPQSYITGG